jgi:hypothetical protein
VNGTYERCPTAARSRSCRRSIRLQSSRDSQPLDNILDQNLGNRLSIKPKVTTADALNASPFTWSFHLIIDARLEYLYPTCSATEQIPRCECMLREKFLERWLCIKCYEHEIIFQTIGGVFVNSRLVYRCSTLATQQPQPPRRSLICLLLVISTLMCALVSYLCC